MRVVFLDDIIRWTKVLAINFIREWLGEKKGIGLRGRSCSYKSNYNLVRYSGNPCMLT